MATTINADTTNGLVITPDTSGDLNFQSSGSNIFTIDSSGNTVFSGALSWSGDLAVNTNTLYVDATNNNVGIGTSTLQNYGTGITNFTVAGSNIPLIFLNSTGAASNAKLWRWIARSDSTMQFQTLEDNYGGERNIWNVVRSGADISYQAWHTGASIERMRITSTGALLIGTTSYSSTSNGTAIGGNNLSSTSNDSFNISLNKASGAPQPTYIFMAYNNGLVGYINYNGAGGVNYNSSSDYRLKENNVNIIDGIEKVKLLKPYRFNFIAHPDKTVNGFFAHEVQDVVPEAVSGAKDAVDDDGNPVYQGIDQSKLVPLLTAALQEAITKIEDLETRIQALESN